MTTPKHAMRRYFLGALILSCMLSSFAKAAEVEVQVTNIAGATIENAVVYLEPKDKTAPFIKNQAEIAQKNKTFIPLVTVIQAGSTIIFPNKDSVRHHIYSFSPAKTFELKLYSGVPSTPVVFDKAGTVVLGCNIHDQMLAFVYIVDTPYFAKTDASGKVKISDVPNGDYLLKVWHYGLKKENVTVDRQVSTKDIGTIKMVIDTKVSI
ncbi:methylamine utilization protein [Methylotenera sp.]|uniref:methylamine utilization protein n=1 Tax=Methylotenera sp. TaxID=2051956 RepID=UPI0024875E5F|nr:methylamine utilization protein [Methylotenera sp.]MDI1298672.1 methylamine utilization protein [Methylotenera sp.]